MSGHSTHGSHGSHSDTYVMRFAGEALQRLKRPNSEPALRKLLAVPEWKKNPVAQMGNSVSGNDR
jgi:hypothetical protein